MANNKKGMRVKEVGATINLGEYSSLRVTIGEESEYAGLDIGRAQKYLQNIAEAVDGVLNLPNASSKINKETAHKVADKAVGAKVKTYDGSDILYDHQSHTYTSRDGAPYKSVTQFIEQFYPFTAGDVIKQEYMDFATNYGELVHTAVQNTLIGKAPKKIIVKTIVDGVKEKMGDYIGRSVVEQIIEDPKHGIAGRFDIVSENDNDTIDLWDVKTNSDIYAKVDCELPEELRDQFNQWWGTETIYGEHCLQLNIYAYILETVYEKKVDGIHIIYIPDDELENIIDVPKQDITKIFEAGK